MGTRGRKSAASLELVGLASVRPAVPRIDAPAYLTAAERDVWRLTVSALPGGWFAGEQAPLLTRYCCHVARAEAIEARLRGLDPVGGGDGYAKLARLAAGETKAILALARAMRLTQQARLHLVTAGRRAAAEPRIVDEAAAIRGCIEARRRK